ncbi:L,D-transpeptidase family protein [Limimaricola litoreus]|uniref:L,D-transpeptidase family protein n=1 Tax=Limimaricola litoreus TaxID=2955316 RepID=A0A9X2FZ72_9RHOB|nr:L,D-transpeptidase family protein [Limimaricola litoreus]MCP1170213.1 L,D-transpeptidase family protein [Limimaricola litoreus]
MTRNLTRLSLSVLALAASGAVAQQSDDSGAEIAAETREMLQGTAPDAGAETTPSIEAAPSAPSSAQGDTTAPAANGSAAQPETLRMLEQSGAQPVEAQQGAAQDGAPSTPSQSQSEPQATSGSDSTSAPIQASEGPPTAQQIEAASYTGGPLPDGQSAITVKTQILLDRAHVSPGIIDGWKGGMSESAIAAFETREGFEADGQLDSQVWDALTAQAPAPMMQSYTITEEDVSGLSDPLPDDYAKLAELDQLGFTSVAEKLAERFHMDQEFLETLNPNVGWRAGESITVVDPGPRLEIRVTRVEVRKGTSRLAGFDETGTMVLNYPVTIGSSQTPSPSGTVEVVAVAMDPTYTYNPDVNFQQGDNDEMLILPPGPNGPVGSVWIDLSKPTYGLHGTSDPDSLFNAASHGCVRMTNWDAEELAHLVSEGVTVEFVE